MESERVFLQTKDQVSDGPGWENLFVHAPNVTMLCHYQYLLEKIQKTFLHLAHNPFKEMI
jgi:hypothetical protein